ncbi:MULTISPECIES: transposase DNA-binding-containing protein [Sorangium]|uniref:Transposase Tn5-like N-terminal domain-containing protein n=1 Tax=Sorangium cellulosum TaxID=56 RepID=A0A4P2R3I0_SORCE|nr:MULTISPECIES: transposase DNA-binding-containing protein [Sorangium]AUX37580.1 uncharacterized protein SOCE836_098090 [Sorangium cellulosum]WCQ96870.1 hypothetical protein NQZ70_09659 [Sorangium sp. Soce836]
MSDAHFADARLSKRQTKLVQKLAQAPDKSFPSLLSDSELEAAYRFFGNEAVTPPAILAPHVRATLARMAAEPVVLAVHDTTTLSFRTDGQRQGLGRLHSSGQTSSPTSPWRSVPMERAARSACSPRSTHVRDDHPTGNAPGEARRWKHARDAATTEITAA